MSRSMKLVAVGKVGVLEIDLDLQCNWVNDMIQMSHDIMVDYTLFVIFESTSLQQRQAPKPTIPNAMDTIATTLGDEQISNCCP